MAARRGGSEGAKLAAVGPAFNDGRYRTAERSARRLATLAGLVAVAPAAGCDSGKIVDDFGIGGYARIRGTVIRADGTRFANRSILFTCGAMEPGFYGRTAPTDAAGRYDAIADAPAAGSVPPSGEMVCRVQAPGDEPPFATAQATVRFSQTPRDRPTTVIDVIEAGAGEVALPTTAGRP